MIKFFDQYFIIGVLFCIFAARHTVAAPCYCADNGSDLANPCTDASHPCLTLGHALTSGSSCQRIALLSSTFTLSEACTVTIPDTIPEFWLTGSPSTITCNTSTSPFSALTLATGPGSTLAAVNLANLTFQGCRALLSGGALRVNHSAPGPLRLQVSGCTFRTCTATCSGGAVDLVASSAAGELNVTMTETHFVANTISDSDSAACLATPVQGGGGGAMSVISTSQGQQTNVEITGCTFSQNAARGAAALLAVGVTRLSLTSATFQSNAMTYSKALQAGATVFVAEAGQLDVASCIFKKNSITTDQSAADIGLALYIISDSAVPPRFGFARKGHVLIRDSSFTENRVEPPKVSSASVVAITGMASANLSNSLWESSRILAVGTVQGGALRFVGDSAVLSDLRFFNNHADGADILGGAVYIELPNDPPLLDRCLFANNHAVAQFGKGSGGALYMKATTGRLRDSVFQSTICEAKDVLGGSLYLDTTTFSLENCSFVQSLAHADLSAQGGAVYVSGAAIFTDVTFTANTATARNAIGGAIASEAHKLVVGETIVLNRASFFDNVVDASMSGAGGALSVWLAEQFDLSGQLGHTNTNHRLARFGAVASDFTAAGDLRVHGCRLERNVVRAGLALGGAFHLDNLGSVEIHDTIFLGGPQLASSLFTMGGCVYIQSTPDSWTRLANTTFRGCEAQDGGAMAVTNGTQLQIYGGDITGCTASEDGGGISLWGRLSIQENFACSGCSAMTGGCVWASNSNVTVRSATFRSNTARISGGAFFVDKTHLILNDTHCSGNQVERGDGAVVTACDGSITTADSGYVANQADSGGVFSTRNTPVVSLRSKYSANLASSGAVWFLYGGSFQSTDDSVYGALIALNDILHPACCFTNVSLVSFVRVLMNANHASLGGAISVSQCHLVVTDSNFTANTADQNGGTIRALNSTVEISGSHFRGNKAQMAGGVLCFESRWDQQAISNTLRVVRSTFERNSASVRGQGGVLWADHTTASSFDDCLFADNEAMYVGGVLAAEMGADLVCTRCTFSGNRAKEAGAAIWLTVLASEKGRGSAIRLVDSLFDGQTGVEGIPQGAIHLTNVESGLLHNVTFLQNRGGALYLAGTAAHLGAGCLFANNTPSTYGTPLNVLLDATSLLTVEQPELLNDTSVTEGSMWVYVNASFPAAQASGVPLLPRLHAAILQPGSSASQQYKSHADLAKPATEVTLRLAHANTFSNFRAQCLFALDGSPNLTASTGFYLKHADDDEQTGTCLLPATQPNLDRFTYNLWLSNDGLENTFVGTLTVYRNWWAEFAPALIGVGSAVALTIVGLLLFFLVRWVRLKRATTIELASWRSYQVASVDFTHLKIRERIGHGAAGEVFKGDLNGTAVAVKRLFDTSQTEAKMADFKREVAMMRTLRHPYIVALIGATFENPKLIITEFMGRGSLYALLHDEAVRLPMELRLRMAFDMARGPTRVVVRGSGGMPTYIKRLVSPTAGTPGLCPVCFVMPLEESEEAPDPLAAVCFAWVDGALDVEVRTSPGTSFLGDPEGESTNSIICLLLYGLVDAHPYADAAVAKPAGHKKKKKPSDLPTAPRTAGRLEMSDKDLKNPLCPSLEGDMGDAPDKNPLRSLEGDRALCLSARHHCVGRPLVRIA
ncbi:putative mitogen-activated protein kinase [Paratrimastix pyriformis]|uniref:Mitogen-activated protein kinase n=1 Tax=Paratrimastix pyriformis TaxID=342808 RepID=A0ABQ8U436_9EUKA|nr:putative mitogen-activated protein kinase [Paratrimastix pyriformis]